MAFRSRLVTAGVAVGVICGVAACGSHEGTVGVLTARATHDLRCSPRQLQWQELAEHTYSARGCGGEVTYTCTRNTYSRYASDWSCVKESEGEGSIHRADRRTPMESPPIIGGEKIERKKDDLPL